MKKFLILALCYINFFTQANHSIIPEPFSYEAVEGVLISQGFKFKDNSKLKKVEFVKTIFNEYLESINISKLFKTA